MLVEKQDVFLSFVQTQEHGPKQRAGCQIERPLGLFAGQPADLELPRRWGEGSEIHLWQVGPPTTPTKGRGGRRHLMDPLHGFSVDDGKSGAKRLVTPHDLAQTALEGGNRQRSLKPNSHELHGETLRDARDHLRGQERMAPELEEVVVHPDPLPPENPFPDPHQDLLRCRAGGRPGIGPRPLGQCLKTESSPIDLAARLQGEGLELGERSRYHELGHLLQKGTQLASPEVHRGGRIWDANNVGQ